LAPDNYKVGGLVEAVKSAVDRRRSKRFLVNYPVSYVLEKNREVSAGMAVNLSEGGLLACFFDRISIGAELDLEMFYAHELQFTALSAQARIVWKDIMETSEAIEYQYGIEFMKMDREEKTRLYSLLASINPTHAYST